MTNPDSAVAVMDHSFHSPVAGQYPKANPQSSSQGLLPRGKDKKSKDPGACSGRFQNSKPRPLARPAETFLPMEHIEGSHI